MSEQMKSVEYHQQCKEALASEQSQSLSQTNNWAHVDKNQVHADWDALYRQLAPLIDHSSSEAPEIQSIIHQHFLIVSRFYKPSKRAYIGMSLFYAENDDMRNFHNSYHPGMVAFLAKAMPFYANENL